MQFVMFAISTFALLVIAVTMLARANDLRWRKGLHWNARLAGFALAGATPFGMIGHEWITREFPTVYECVFRVGLMLVFFTTPHLPPWWRFIGFFDPTAHDVHHSDDRRKPQ